MSNLVKYPRTPHLPWSEGITKDDRILEDIKYLLNKDMVVSLKMDGENTTMYQDHIHARSLDSADHPSRHMVKGIWSALRWRIPEGWRICGENLYAKHSIYYKSLDDYFQVFFVFDDKNICLGYDTTVDFCKDLGLTHVPVIFKGNWADALKMRDDLSRKFYFECSPDNNEGYVVRTRFPFPFESFCYNVAKYVRAHHVQTDEHWMYSKIIKNELKK